MISFILLFILSAIGIGETIYLTRKRLASQQPVCPIHGDCEKVLNSKYSKIFFIPLDILGLLFYLSVLIIATLVIIEVGPIDIWSLALKTLIAIASLMSIFFTYLQWQVIKAWCFWCLMSAFTTWLMGIIILTSTWI